MYWAKQVPICDIWQDNAVKVKEKKTKKNLYLNNALLLTNQAFQFNPIKYLQLIARKHKTNEKMKQMGVGNKHTGSFGSYQNNTVELYVWVGLEKECCSQVCFSSWIKKEKKKKEKEKQNKTACLRLQ